MIEKDAEKYVWKGLQPKKLAYSIVENTFETMDKVMK